MLSVTYEPFMVGVIMLNVGMLSVIMLSVGAPIYVPVPPIRYFNMEWFAREGVAFQAMCQLSYRALSLSVSLPSVSK
jgi:hypothetical protein